MKTFDKQTFLVEKIFCKPCKQLCMQPCKMLFKPQPYLISSSIFYHHGRAGKVALHAQSKKPFESWLKCMNPTFLISRWKAAPHFLGSVISIAGIPSTAGMCGTQSKQVTSISKHHLLPPFIVTRMDCIILCCPLMRQILLFMPKNLFWTEK